MLIISLAKGCLLGKKYGNLASSVVGHCVSSHCSKANQIYLSTDVAGVLKEGDLVN